MPAHDRPAVVAPVSGEEETATGRLSGWVLRVASVSLSPENAAFPYVYLTPANAWSTTLDEARLFKNNDLLDCPEATVARYMVPVIVSAEGSIQVDPSARAPAWYVYRRASRRNPSKADRLREAMIDARRALRALEDAPVFRSLQLRVAQAEARKVYKKAAEDFLQATSEVYKAAVEDLETAMWANAATPAAPSKDE